MSHEVVVLDARAGSGGKGVGKSTFNNLDFHVLRMSSLTSS